MANNKTTIHQLSPIPTLDLLDELAIYDISQNTTNKVTLSDIRPPFDIFSTSDWVSLPVSGQVNLNHDVYWVPGKYVGLTQAVMQNVQNSPKRVGFSLFVIPIGPASTLQLWQATNSNEAYTRIKVGSSSPTSWVKIQTQQE